jgi:hypothetical protein
MPVDRKTAEAMLYEFESALGRNSRDDIPAARAALLDAMTLPDGRVLVPKVPTPAMLEAGVLYRMRTSLSPDNPWPKDTASLYLAMLAAAPQKEDK